MAYADTNTATRKTGTALAVFALEAGLAWALVVGLSMDGKTRIADRLIATFVPKPDQKPKTPPPPPPQHHDQRDLTPIKPPPSPFDGLKGAEAPSFPLGPIDPPSGAGINEVKFVPTIPPPAKPGFAPKFARPKGNPGAWVSPNDYPTRDLNEGNEGVTRFRLTLSAEGKVTDCTVTQSSGFPDLDAATCEKLARRAKFDPASDETGAQVPGSYSGAVRWQIPE